MNAMPKESGKGHAIPLKLEFQAVERGLVWVLGTKSCRRAAGALNLGAISPAQFQTFFKNVHPSGIQYIHAVGQAPSLFSQPQNLVITPN